MQVQKFGAAPKIFGVENMQNFGQFYTHKSRLWSRISPEKDKISKIGKTSYRELFLPRSTKQVRWTLVHYP